MEEKTEMICSGITHTRNLIELCSTGCHPDGHWVSYGETSFHLCRKSFAFPYICCIKAAVFNVHLDNEISERDAVCIQVGI